MLCFFKKREICWRITSNPKHIRVKMKHLWYATMVPSHYCFFYFLGGHALLQCVLLDTPEAAWPQQHHEPSTCESGWAVHTTYMKLHIHCGQCTMPHLQYLFSAISCSTVSFGGTLCPCLQHHSNFGELPKILLN